MARVAIITSTFPYGVGEQFFEAELPHWVNSGHEVWLLPMRSTEAARPIPSQVQVDDSLSVLDTFRRKGGPLDLVHALTDRSTLREVADMLRTRTLTLRGVAEIISTEAQVRSLRTRIRKVVTSHGGFDAVYAYWHGPAAYAAAAEAARGTAIGKTVARAHRVDLLEETRPSGHHPRKRHYQNMIHTHAPISDMAATYLTRTYGVDPDRISVARLGVSIPDGSSNPSPVGTLQILSTSYVTPIKRVPSILRAVDLAAESLPSTRVEWTHLGSGPDFDELTRSICDLSSQNVTATLLGQVDHDSVLEYMRSHPVDLFVNFSTSEGVPVSIMEAMVHGIPAIAPNIGGISELVTSECGALLPEDATTEDLAKTIVDMAATCKDPSIRSNAAERIRELYDAEANFRQFISETTST